MLGRRHEIARLQSDFYRDQYYNILRWLIWSLCIMFGLLAIIFYLILFQPSPRYYANTTDGIILSMPTPTVPQV